MNGDGVAQGFLGDFENKFLGVRKSLSSLGVNWSKAVSKVPSNDLLGFPFASSKNGCTQLVLLSCNCLLYSLAAALSSLALSLAAFLTDAV